MDMKVKGTVFTSVEFDGEAVTIKRGPFSPLGRSTKTILVRNITAVQFKPATRLANGFIEFTIGGGVERQSRSRVDNQQARDAAKNENAASFNYKTNAEFQALADAVNAAIRAA